MFLKRVLLEKGAADECDHSVARRMGEGRPAVYDKCRKIGDENRPPEEGRESKVLEKQAGVPDKGFPPLSGHCVSCYAIDGC